MGYNGSDTPHPDGAFAQEVNMNYRTDKYGNPISVLGFGCMRFRQTMGRIDLEAAEEQIMAAFRGGVNYYDTAYVYPGSEAHCPQSIPIRRELKNARRALEGPAYKVVRWAVRTFKLYG